ncbi:transcriptional regulator, PadR-family (plasmid) [Gemmatirosa kalamazoonensis]|uniref:Transcriptional regulator, PadR-family n=1 Tax=Gemmatirosa kalamazoonensis TaxID=861299 RepID=W0RSY7_9BACT|nr:PadR family transcriptional regulator [Gemmatirosa kalamazoonensis]AHG93430.1 transcriptional regulator, PadR-family [Gemmatirosa kalamazoonensis]
MPDTLPFLKGTLDVLALKALAWAPMHGFELTRWIEERSGAAFVLDEAAVYQALYRMETRGLVAADWGTSEKGRRARYYRLTAAGRAHLRREAALWRRYAEVVAAILEGA